MNSLPVFLMFIALLNPIISLAEVREDFFGKSEGYPAAIGYPFNSQPGFRVGAYSGKAIDILYKDRDIFFNPTRTGRVTPQITGKFPFSRNPDHIIDKYPILAMALMKDGVIIYERYRYGTDQNTRFNSESMAKSFTALVVGKAVEDGHIKSLDEKIGNIIPEIKGSAIGEATIREALTMTCGNDFKFSTETARNYLKIKFARRGEANFPNIYDYFNTLSRVAPGKVFSYDPHCTDALAMVINRVTGRRFSKYFEDTIWKKINTTGRGSWMNMNINPNLTSAANLFNATLHDYSRLALLMLQDGKVDGQQIISADWVKEMTKGIVPVGNYPSRFMKYGYQTWVRRDEPNSWYGFLGYDGQRILIDRNSGSAMIIFALEEDHSTDTYNFWEWFITRPISDFKG